uniref:Uncharacterized protein n=1 Tax=Oryza brachyantha TaxID=4533 RepID=J3LBH2_ORYBR
MFKARDLTPQRRSPTEDDATKLDTRRHGQLQHRKRGVIIAELAAQATSSADFPTIMILLPACQQSEKQLQQPRTDISQVTKELLSSHGQHQTPNEELHHVIVAKHHHTSSVSGSNFIEQKHRETSCPPQERSGSKKTKALMNH